MARTFQAYQCGCAMLLDMHSLEHTYMALYAHNADQHDGAAIDVAHLVAGMADADRDNCAFFYILRRQ